MDIEKDLSNKNYGSAKKKLEDIESSNFLKAEKRAELYQKVSKFETSAIAETIAVNAPYGLMSDIEAVVSTKVEKEFDKDPSKKVEATSLIDKEINFKLKTISEKGWVLGTSNIWNHPVSVARKIKKNFDNIATAYKFKRVQTAIRSDFGIGIRFAKWLGLTNEGLMRNYGFDGSDHYRFARIY